LEAELLGQQLLGVSFFQRFPSIVAPRKRSQGSQRPRTEARRRQYKFFFYRIVDANAGRKFTAVKTNIIMDLEEKAQRQRAAIDMKKERQKNKRRKNKKPVNFFITHSQTERRVLHQER
jgi:hypothetical protein